MSMPVLPVADEPPPAVFSPVPEPELPLAPGTVVRLASAERAAALLAEPDAYTARLTRFDLAAKLGRREPGTAAEYLAHAAAQVLAWTPDEVEAMAANVTLVSGALAELGLELPLPPVVEVVRSTLAEEGFMAAYTRRDVVVLGAPALGARTFAHELFHVLSRHAPALRAPLYAHLGFAVVAPIAIPAALAGIEITNPDVPALDAVVAVPQEGEGVHGAPLLVAARPYAGGPLAAYAEPALLLVERRGESFEPRLENGEPVLLHPEDVAGLAERLGGNTKYDIHPEEVCAEHFTFMLAGDSDLPRPDLVAAMWETLRGHRSGATAASLAANPGAPPWPT